MWNQIDELRRIRYGNQISRSTLAEELFRQELEAAKNDVQVQPGQTISVSTAKSLISRIKDFVHDNAQNKNIGNLEAIRRDLDELNFFNNEEIRRSRFPTKSDKRHAELVRALMVNKDKSRVDEFSGSIVIDALLTHSPALDQSPNGHRHKLEHVQQERQQKNRQEPVVDPIYEDLIKPELERYREPPPPGPDFEIVDEGMTERNLFDKEKKEEVFK
jgi:protein-tyrosine-phosphatase